MIGKTLAHYRIEAKIGAGGMGEVYRATDSKLGREVALKVLPEAFARDAERMARFHREAQVLASLNHPHIAAIYGLEKDGDQFALALELVEGPTLGDRLRAGNLSLEEVLGIAAQIAEAMEYAHESGVMHRDLKPENIKLTADGRVKVLDFGLAKALEGDAALSGSASDLSSPTVPPTLTSPVITGALTGMNVILGTAAYMAPEQARGQAVDKRADIWAFGVVLFEMLTRHRLFSGETVSDTLAAVLKTDPPWEKLPADTPPRIRRLLRYCLARNPKERLRDIGDARLVLCEVLDGEDPDEPVAAGAGAAPVAAGPGRPWLLPAAVLLAAAIAAAATWLLGPSAPEPPLRKFAIAQAAGAAPTQAALAPDASAVAYLRGSALYVQDFRDVDARELVTGRDLAAPFWSPDGEWIGYGADAALWKIRRTGGSAVRLASLDSEQRLSSVGGAAWGADGHIAFASGSAGMWRVSAQGGDVADVAAPGEGISDFHDASALPDGAGWLVSVHAGDTFDEVAAVLPDGSLQKIFAVPGERLFDPRWSPTGHIVFARAGSARGVYAVPVNRDGWHTTGEPFLVAGGFQYPSIARDGTLAMIRSAVSQSRRLTLLDRDGNILRTFGPPGRWSRWPTLSNDGTQILSELADDEGRDLWLVDTERGTTQRATDENGTEYWGFWSADGSELLYASGDGESAMVRARPANGAGQPREIARGFDPVPTADGRWLFITREDSTGGEKNDDLWILPLEEEGAEPRPFLATASAERVSFPSPVDPFVAYVSNQSGENEVYLTTYPDVRGQWPVSVGGGEEPRWRGDGRELYYVKNDSLMVVDVERAGNAPKLGAPQFLFARPDAGRTQAGPTYGMYPSRDGQTFLISMEAELAEAEVVSLVVVLNWFEEFRER